MSINSFIFIGFDTLSLNIAGTPYNVDSSHENWDEIVAAVKASDFESIPELINVSKALETFVGFSNIQVNAEYGTITYMGQPINNTLVDHIFRMKDEGFDINPMLKFLNNLMENPSKRAVDELYGFLQAGKMPITEDGHFIAYKRVRDDYKSVHDGKTDNSVGTVLEMPRNMVNDNSAQTCSHGLHFCSQGYLNHFSGSRIMILKVNPRDVVSIPADYNDTKGRACRYEVVGELTEEQKQTALKTNIFTQAVHNGIEEAKKAAPSGAKMTKGFFGKGYVAGYVAALNDEGYECYYDGNDATYGERLAYEDGYDQGWDDGRDGEDMRFTTQEYEAATGDVEVPQVVARATSPMYEQGFKDGKGHRAKQYYTDAEYLRGYKDGRSA